MCVWVYLTLFVTDPLDSGFKFAEMEISEYKFVVPSFPITDEVLMIVDRGRFSCVNLAFHI